MSDDEHAHAQWLAKRNAERYWQTKGDKVARQWGKRHDDRDTWWQWLLAVCALCIVLGIPVGILLGLRADLGAL